MHYRIESGTVSIVDFFPRLLLKLKEWIVSAQQSVIDEPPFSVRLPAQKSGTRNGKEGLKAARNRSSERGNGNSTHP